MLTLNLSCGFGKRTGSWCVCFPSDILSSQIDLKKTIKQQRAAQDKVTFFPSDEVSEANRGESDDDEVNGLQRAPAFDVLEDHSWQGDEDEATEQDEEQCGDDSDLRLADVPFLKQHKMVAF